VTASPSGAEWFARRSSCWTEWPVRELLDAKERAGHRVSVVIPARDEEGTVGGVVSAIRADLQEGTPLVDELVVIDSDSTDDTAAVARSAGATVHASAAIASVTGTYPGKGEAIWKSLFVTTGDLVVFVDADLTHWGTHFVTGLLGPLLADPDTLLVKGFYDRLVTDGHGSPASGGGRVTELVARPLLNLWWPDLAEVVQPLAGEWSARRSLIETVAVPTAYGVELATLIDTLARHGLDAIAQVDLGARGHEHQKDHDLALMAAEILAVAQRRLTAGTPDAGLLRQPLRDGGRTTWRVRAVPLSERPPAADTPGYARTTDRAGARR
jgi:glucosyl-3-phosphoglycerate synthase